MCVATDWCVRQVDTGRSATNPEAAVIKEVLSSLGFVFWDQRCEKFHFIVSFFVTVGVGVLPSVLPFRFVFVRIFLLLFALRK